MSFEQSGEAKGVLPNSRDNVPSHPFNPFLDIPLAFDLTVIIVTGVPCLQITQIRG